VTLSVVFVTFGVVDVEVELKDRARVENIFSSQRPDYQVLAAHMGLWLEVDPRNIRLG
jgi:hypothetical protein